jgi:hypothetical protein
VHGRRLLREGKRKSTVFQFRETGKRAAEEIQPPTNIAPAQQGSS